MVRQSRSKPAPQPVRLNDIDPKIQGIVLEATQTYWAPKGKKVSALPVTEEQAKAGYVHVDDVRLKAPFYCSKMMRLVIDHYARLGLSADEAMIVLQQVAAWMWIDLPSFLSARTMGKRTGRDPRTVRRYQKSIEQKGYLVRKSRFEKTSDGGRRQTTNGAEYSGLLNRLVALDAELKAENKKTSRKVVETAQCYPPDISVRGAMTAVSGRITQKRTPVSALEEAKIFEEDAEIDSSSSGSGTAALRAAHSLAPAEQARLSTPGVGVCENPAQLLPSERSETTEQMKTKTEGPEPFPRKTDVQEEKPVDMKEKAPVTPVPVPVAMARLKSVIEGAKQVSAEAREEKEAKKLIKAKAVKLIPPETGPDKTTWEEKEAKCLLKIAYLRDTGSSDKMRMRAALGFFKPFLAEQMLKFPKAPCPKDWSGAMVGQLGQLLKTWGFSETRQLIAHVFDHWSSLSRIVKNAGSAPSLGVIVGYSQSFMDDMLRVKNEEEARAERRATEQVQPAKVDSYAEEMNRRRKVLCAKDSIPN